MASPSSRPRPTTSRSRSMAAGSSRSALSPECCVGDVHTQLHRNAMLRVLTFDGYKPSDDDAPHKRIFDMLWFAVMAQGDPRQGGARGRAEVKKNRRIKAEFRDIGQRLPSAAEGIEGRDVITLAETGGVVTLAEDDYKRVVELMEAVPWKGGNLDDVEDAFDWLDK